MDFKKEILRLKKEKNAAILVHNYQIPAIQDLSDFVGDSLELAIKARDVKSDLIVMCGVDFMAETVKILNSEKMVLIPSNNAKCPMAAQLNKSWIERGKKKYPDSEVVLYVNTTAESKAFADCCCTSANADRIVNAMEASTVLFGPDRNLAYYVAKRSKKKIVPIPTYGYCYVHRKILLKHVLKSKKEHPNAEIVVHPECNPDVQEAADVIASTSGMVNYCKKSDAKEFIIGTEVGLLYRLEKENPGKRFYPAYEEAVCIQQKDITAEKLYLALEKEQFEVNIQKDTSRKAARAIERMIEISRNS